jgi:hypothetical protein
MRGEKAGRLFYFLQVIARAFIAAQGQLPF